MSKKDKEYTVDYFEYQANETRKKYIEELDKVLAIYKRALELACDRLQGKDFAEITHPKFYLERAKKELEEQE